MDGAKSKKYSPFRPQDSKSLSKWLDTWFVVMVVNEKEPDVAQGVP
jgi:hypothetical protein